MNHEALKARIQELRALRDEQQARLARGQEECRNAQQGIALIEGGLQDCQYWQGVLDRAEQAKREAAALAGGIPAGAFGDLFGPPEVKNGEAAAAAEQAIPESLKRN